MLNRDLRAYLPDNDKDAAIALRELVARKATTEFRSNHEVRREDVLDTIGVRLDDLFPARNVLESPPVVIPRAQMPDLVRAITQSSTPIIVSADGGYGKSIVATQIGAALPGGTTFVYDCFGNGGYRSATGLRHHECIANIRKFNLFLAPSVPNRTSSLRDLRVDALDSKLCGLGAVQYEIL